MNNYAFMAETIKERVTFGEAAQYYGLTFNRSGFALCPFHAEKTPSFKIHGNKGHCFGCQWHDDVVGFVRDLFSLSFLGALDKINTDFNLMIPLDRRPTLREQRDAEKRHREIMAERERQEAKRRAREDLYNTLWDGWYHFDRNRTEYAPQSEGDNFHPLFVEALKKIDYQSYLIDTLL